MKRTSAFFLAFIIFLISAFPVYADKSASQLQSELTNLNKDMKTLEQELKSISNQAKKTSSRLDQNKRELAEALGQEQTQLESMTLRIKYMYENGKTGAIDMLFSSSCLAEFLSRAEYILQISQYDRTLLEEYKATRKHVAAQQEELEKEQARLSQLENKLEEKEAELKKQISKTSKDLSSYLAQLEDTKQDLNHAQSSSKEEIKPVKPNTGNSGSSGNSGAVTQPTTGTGVAYTEEDAVLLAALIECEAGSRNYEGMLAVGSVVVNRMNHSRFPNTLYGVVYHPGQFPPALNGKVDRIINRGIKSSCLQAAKDALNGKNNVGSCLSFRAASSGRPGLVIGDNVFF